MGSTHLERSDRYWLSTAEHFDNHYRAGLVTRAFLHKRTAVLSGMLRVTPEMRLADVGCGSGIQLLCLAPHVREAVGFDFSQQMIDIAKARLQQAEIRNVVLTQADARDLPAGPASFDAVISLGLLDYLPDAARAIREMARILVPGGDLIVTAPKTPSLLGFLRGGPGLWLREKLLSLPPIVNAMDRRDITEALRRCELRVVELQSIWTTMWIAHCVKPLSPGCTSTQNARP